MKTSVVNKLPRRILSLVLGCLFPLAAYAGDGSGTIKYLSVRADGLHWLELNGTHNNRPACAQNQQYWMIQNENSNSGRDQYAMLLSAYISNRRVVISGANSCSRWSDGEDISYVWIQD